jgi:hypothetical protein
VQPHSGLWVTSPYPLPPILWEKGCVPHSAGEETEAEWAVNLVWGHGTEQEKKVRFLECLLHLPAANHSWAHQHYRTGVYSTILQKSKLRATELNHLAEKWSVL